VSAARSIARRSFDRRPPLQFGLAGAIRLRADLKSEPSIRAWRQRSPAGPAAPGCQHLPGRCCPSSIASLARECQDGFFRRRWLLRIFATASGFRHAFSLVRMPRSAPIARTGPDGSEGLVLWPSTHQHLGRLAGFLSRRASSTAISSNGFHRHFKLASSKTVPSTLDADRTL